MKKTKKTTVKKPLIKAATDPYCPPGYYWDKEKQQCVLDVG